MNKNHLSIVTGGVGDIGTAICKMLSKQCKHVFAMDIVEKTASQDWLKTLQEEGFNNIHFHLLDVTDYDQCGEVITNILSDFGPIDVLVNNAGITRDAVFTKMTKKQWDNVINVNLNGMFNVTHHVVNNLRENEYGRIVNISSVNALRGQFSQANYAASKAGVLGFTKSLAQELVRYNITVNSLSPGYVNTRLMEGIRPDILEGIIQDIPAKRLAEPNEIAWAVQFLIDRRSQYITGANLNINGGLYFA
ncbi:acetoacetyl-CoA reductase [Legionella sp. W05-934-2]|jgi:acetoacetyl-CoA reductase|uniref:acetoacetyl-CoA reductase n=1 Tax=Legionella sp. W05-934-2 TaxID=1198649 RepID=UPI003463806B